ncbi:S8 family peptidase [Exiguobacterium flavidum]|uniref:S8 family peptidase n=1 Tax=Exiguobacterium flavidum TaxID=2184695 RepID=UPI000DF7C6B8|nr:S8 family serine peptidase [Exiguobacterium flavidum]
MKKHLALLTLTLAVSMPTSALANSYYVKYDASFTNEEKKAWMASEGLQEVRPLEQAGFSLVEPIKPFGKNNPELIEIKTVEKSMDTSQLKQKYLDQAHIPMNWKYTKGKSDIRVAVIDDAIDTTHHEFKNAIYKTTTLSGPKKADDHGTHVAGIIGARADGKGIVGVAPGVRLIGIDVFDGDYASSIDVGNGILYAINNGADVINLSLGQYEHDKYIESAVKKAEARNIPVVAAAGNDGKKGLLFPATMKEAIAVGSINTFGSISAFSNYGIGLDLMAPGEGMYSSIVGNRYGFMDGTSMATPVVSGVIALMKSINPFMTNATVVSKVNATATKKSGDTVLRYGNGRLNAGVIATVPAPISKIIVPKTAQAKQSFKFSYSEWSTAVSYVRIYKDSKLLNTFVERKIRDGVYSHTYTPQAKGTYRIEFTSKLGRHVRTTARDVIVN